MNSLKISLTVAVYNEAESIKNLLDSIAALDYPRTDFELSIVDDGSTDRTSHSIKDWIAAHPDIQTRYNRLEQNQGRIRAREAAAKNATFETLLITDARCTLFPDVLHAAAALNYEPIVGNPKTSQNGKIGRFFYLLRSKLYPGSFGDDFADVFIEPSNFDRVGKGTTIFLVNKNLFLESIPAEKNRHSNDDITILASIAAKKKILKTAKLKCFYDQREDFRSEIVHTFHRGPRFADYYYKPGRKYFWLINIALIITVVLFLGIIFGSIFNVIFPILIVDLMVSWWLGPTIRDKVISAVLLPAIAGAFWFGIIYGLFLKLVPRTSGKQSGK